MKRNTDLSALVLRLSVGVLMLLHGIAKFSGVSYIEGMLQTRGLPGFVAYGVYIGEVVAPLLIIIGYRTKLASLVFMVNIVFATYLAHAKDIFSLNKYGGWGVELLGLYFFGALALFLLGGGKFAVSKNNAWD